MRCVSVNQVSFVIADNTAEQNEMGWFMVRRGEVRISHRRVTLTAATRRSEYIILILVLVYAPAYTFQSTQSTGASSR